MVLGRVLDILHAVPALPSGHLDGVPILSVHTSDQAKNHAQPERSVFHEVHFAIVVHRVRGTGEVEGVFVSGHVSLELNGILGGHCLSIRVVKV